VKGVTEKRKSLNDRTRLNAWFRSYILCFLPSFVVSLPFAFACLSFFLSFYLFSFSFFFPSFLASFLSSSPPFSPSLRLSLQRVSQTRFLYRFFFGGRTLTYLQAKEEKTDSHTPTPLLGEKQRTEETDCFVFPLSGSLSFDASNDRPLDLLNLRPLVDPLNSLGNSSLMIGLLFYSRDGLMATCRFVRTDRTDGRTEEETCVQIGGGK